MAQIRIYLTNLGKYNEGELVGKWVDLPCDLEEELAEIGVSDEPDEEGRYYEEYFITDYESDIPGLEIDEYANIDELNELAERVEGFDDDEIEVISAYFDAVSKDLDAAIDCAESGDWMIYRGCDNMADVAREYIDQLGGIEFAVGDPTAYFDMDEYLDRYYVGEYADQLIADGEFSEEDYDEAFDYAREVLEQEAYDRLSMGEMDERSLENCFDYESFGRDMEIEGTFAFVDGDCVQIMY